MSSAPPTNNKPLTGPTAPVASAPKKETSISNKPQPTTNKVLPKVKEPVQGN